MGESPRFEPVPHQVWVGRGNLGYRRAIQSAGAVAAPLLAGFSFTLLVLLLPTLPEKRTRVEAGTDVRVITESQAFSALPEVAAILLLLAGLLLVASVQATISMHLHSHTPADYEEWYPQYFRELSPGEAPPVDLEGWSWKGAEPVAVGTKWFGGWPRMRLLENVVTANRWAGRARFLYHAGIMALLLGVTFLVVPPSEARTVGRWILVGVAAAGAVAEATWIGVLQYYDARTRRRRNAAEGST